MEGSWRSLKEEEACGRKRWKELWEVCWDVCRRLRERRRVVEYMWDEGLGVREFQSKKEDENKTSPPFWVCLLFKIRVDFGFLMLCIWEEKVRENAGKKTKIGADIYYIRTNYVPKKSQIPFFHLQTAMSPTYKSLNSNYYYFIIHNCRKLFICTFFSNMFSLT